jgi:hypothetical protein
MSRRNPRLADPPNPGRSHGRPREELMAVRGDFSCPSAGRFSGRLWGGWHGRRQASGEAGRGTASDVASRSADGGGARIGSWPRVSRTGLWSATRTKGSCSLTHRWSSGGCIPVSRRALTTRPRRPGWAHRRAPGEPALGSAGRSGVVETRREGDRRRGLGRVVASARSMPASTLMAMSARTGIVARTGTAKISATCSRRGTRPGSATTTAPSGPGRRWRGGRRR